MYHVVVNAKTHEDFPFQSSRYISVFFTITKSFHLLPLKNNLFDKVQASDCSALDDECSKPGVLPLLSNVVDAPFLEYKSRTLDSLRVLMTKSHHF